MNSLNPATNSDSLDRLSLEIQIIIMSHLNRESLYALIRASPQQLHVFESAKELVLSRILCHTFHASVLPEALAIAMASQLKDRPPDRQHVDAIIRSVKNPTSDHSTVRTMPLKACILLCRLRDALDYFMDDYVQESIKTLADFGHKRVLFEGGTSRCEDEIELDRTLSITELVRLQRAFCRFELYGQLFGTPKQEKTKIRAHEQWNILLAEFPSWQNEELTSVRDYLTRGLCKRFDQVEDDFVQQTLEDGSELYGKYPNRWHRDDAFFTYRAKSDDHKDYIEHMLCLGLPFLKQIFVASGTKLKSLIVSNSQYSGDYLTDAVEQHFLDPDTLRHLQTDGRYGVKLKFEEDSPDNWNAGWMWAGPLYSHWGFALERQRFFRDVGYVFWDYARLEASGLFDQQ